MLQTSMHAAAMSLCIVTAYVTWRSRLAGQFFLYFLIVLALMFCSEWLMAHPLASLKPLWLLIIMTFCFLIGPCALLMASAIERQGVSVCWRYQGALIVIGWILLVPLATVIPWHSGGSSPPSSVSPEYSFFIHSTMLMAVAFFLLQTYSVMRACLGFLKQRRAENQSLFSSNEDAGINTLRLLVIAVAGNACIGTFRVFYCAALDDIQLVNIFIAFSQLLLVVFLCASVLHHVVTIAMGGDDVRNMLFGERCLAGHNESIEAKKYCRSEISEEQYQSIYQKLKVAMDEELLYQRPALSLRELCDHLKEKPHAVSQVINVSEYQNFYELINRRRIDLAARLLVHEPRRNILQIGFECGFNSKSSFNSTFKKYLGMSPSQYRAENVLSHSNLGNDLPV